MKSGGHGGGIEFINLTKHDLSHADIDALKAKAKRDVPEVRQIIVDETPKSTSEFHELSLEYATRSGTFLYCKVAGGDLSQVLKQLKACKKE